MNPIFIYSATEPEEPDEDRCPHNMFYSGAGACPQCGGGADLEEECPACTGLGKKLRPRLYRCHDCGVTFYKGYDHE